VTRRRFERNLCQRMKNFDRAAKSAAMAMFDSGAVEGVEQALGPSRALLMILVLHAAVEETNELTKLSQELSREFIARLREKKP